MPPTFSSPSRRQFLKSLAATAAVAQGAIPLRASIVRPFLAAADASSTSLKLDQPWEYYQGPLAGPWAVWHGDEIAVWEKISLPHCFNHYDACDPDTPYYRGHGWYRTHIPATNPLKNGRTLLHFEGAGQTSQVYIGTKLIGTHVGGYDEFVYDITDALATATPVPGAAVTKGKENGIALAVLCDNSQDLERSPSDLSDFSLYGGLYRHVHLVYAPAVSFESLHITPTVALGAPTKVALQGRLHNPTKLSGNVTLAIRVNDADGKTVHQATKTLATWNDETEIASFEITAPKLWSPKTPHLYTCSVKLSSEHGDSEMTERFGLKHTEWVDHGPFKLNGERLLLRGTQRHMDHAGYAAAQPDDLVRKEMELVKKMGANFIRLGHYQQTSQVLDLCDELGILVWEEAPWCRAGIGDEQWKQQTRTMLAHLIDQHYNHPSILMWGLGNEDDWPNEYPTLDQQAIRSFMQEMNELAHSLDSTRVTSFRRCDFARDIPDVYSPSIWAGWYRGVYTEYQQSLETERERVKHFIHIEWGADSHARRHSENPDASLARIATGTGTDERGLDYLPTGGAPRISKDGDWSESYACNLFDWHLKVQETLPWFTGSAQWIFKDFTTPLRAENPVPRINQKGLLERDMTLKEGYFVFQSYWSEEPMVHLYGHSWPVRWGAEDEQRMVKVYSNCPSAELFVNGKSVGTKQRDSQNFPAAGLRWMANFVPGKNHLRVIAKKNGITLTDEIEFEYQTAKWGKPAKLVLRELAREGDKATVEATLIDANGVLCLDSHAIVHYTLAGSGKLIDNLGTSTGSRVVQMYNGRSQISLQRNNGANTVGVVTEGIPAAFVSIL
ncbi:glycoside hydrolase family 2 protein [Granulicella mallensis]|uniref:Beta-galactosidase n=1 Tax=Granulicella mallensis (strain ATCC BAA-1857 / DSM 23137 / MP5ACTX8) TaxID=682795 RepID=G8NW47_GRAMM|nr:glycoside hydrolase family 2 TIM barrel-domain containing protein [Granulicella mallensis]AEU35467.1 Beta-galactosidase [Granulicella mallensis MP5ACTX8]